MEKYDEEEMLNERLASLQKKFATLSDPIEKQVEKVISQLLIFRQK